MVFSSFVRFLRKNKGSDSDTTSLTVVNDSGINLASADTEKIDFREDFSRIALTKLTRADENLSLGIYELMKECVFSGGVEYKNIGITVRYLDGLLRTSDERSKEVLETAKTVLSYLDDYVNGGREVSFKKYLFGQEGVLTQRRLADMQSVRRVISKGRFDEKRNYKLSKGDSSGKFNVFNVSYTRDAKGRALVNINDNNSVGMNSNHGRLYWNSLDQMFDFNVENRIIDSRVSLNNYLKQYLSSSVRDGRAEVVVGRDWKKNKDKKYYNLG
jgi:hypothetical protein